ncbi:MAG: hypothetical protein ACOC9N_03680, partial [Gemmatimonadota bacterium]
MPSDRRSFLTRLSLGLAAAAAVPQDLLARVRDSTARDAGPAAGGGETGRGLVRRVFGGSTWEAAARGPDGLPDPPPGPLPQEFWEELRRSFLIPEDEAFFNTG